MHFMKSQQIGIIVVIRLVSELYSDNKMEFSHVHGVKQHSNQFRQYIILVTFFSNHIDKFKPGHWRQCIDIY